MLQPALLGGVVIGVLSALPIINLANCCCAWILFGGGLAAYLMQQQRPAPISVGDGALVGLLAGIIGAVIWTVVAIPISAMMIGFESGMLDKVLSNANEMPPDVRSFLESLRSGPVRGLAAVIGFFVTVCVCSVFGMLGGLFGALFFRKNEPPPPPPPPVPSPFAPSFEPPPSFGPPPIVPPIVPPPPSGPEG
jgi:hypothetical protein